MTKRNKLLVIIFFVALVILYLLIYVAPQASKVLEKTMIVKHGQLKVEDEVKCFIIRRETVYGTKSPGSIDYIAVESRQIKKGEPVLKLNIDSAAVKAEEQERAKAKAEGVEYVKEASKYEETIQALGDNLELSNKFYSKRKGVVTYFIDGYEGVLTPKEIEQYKYSNLKNLEVKPKEIKRKQALAGEPLYKICDNAKWYILFWIDIKSEERYQLGRKIRMSMPDGELEAYITKVESEGEKAKILLETNRYYENFAKLRTTEAKAIVVDDTGLLIDNAFITKKDGIEGVYAIATTGARVFKPIMVLATDGKTSLVQEDVYYDDKGQMVLTVKAYDEIVTERIN
ncbi:MAG: HlyD family efflux transporter periplasmic adaptor subunit [Anaerovoracaceae bacterium]